MSDSIRRQGEGAPYLSWCLSVRNCAAMLERCLRSIRERTPDAEIVVIDNMSRDDTAEVARRFADVVDVWAGPQGTWTPDDPWTYDMAASRQRAFELASGRWRGWIDADDVLPGPEEAERLLRLNTRWKPPAGPAGKVEGDAAAPIALTDLLRRVEEQRPDADVVWAPYLYARDVQGGALLWQTRERIVKWSDPPRWRWAEAAHEILVPVEGYKPSVKIEFAHLLFLHERDFSEQANDFAVRRHFDVLSRQYEANDRTTRRCLYLAAYAQQLCPEREAEFVAAAYDTATTDLDRYRALLCRAQMQVRQGLFRDALETFGAAVTVRPDLPDAYLDAGNAWTQIEDWARAAEWYRKGLACAPHSVESYVNPRFHAIRYPVQLADVLAKLAQALICVARHAEAEAVLAEAVGLLHRVHDHPAIGEDKREAWVRLARMDNAYRAQVLAQALWRTADYLFANDEPAKAIPLLDAVPWNLQDHPLILGIEARLKPLRRHLTDPQAYRDFYADEVATGAFPVPDSQWDSVAIIPRVTWLSAWLNANQPDATVLEIGAFDGVIALPVLQQCPGIRYVAADIQANAMALLRDRFADRGLVDRAEAVALGDADPCLMLRDYVGPAGADVTVWQEVIEHVPDPVAELRKVVHLTRDGGRVFVTTPWGAYDAGHPPARTLFGSPRSPLGHVRAMTPRDVVRVFDAVELAVEELYRVPAKDDEFGEGLHVRGRKAPAAGWPAPRTPVAFVVPSALWDWNATSVTTSGMGASEKSIVQTAAALADGFARRVEVYGPVPEAEVRAGVRYWPREQVRHVEASKIVISRSPAYAAVLDREGFAEGLPRLLWLQDSWYDDLTPEVAATYERIVVVSEWHRKAMHERHGVALDAMSVIYNPVEAALYRSEAPERKRDRFVYASSPDRGLVRLLELWPRIRARLPEAELHVCYGWRGAQALGLSGSDAWRTLYASSRRQFEALRHQPGVIVHGMIPPAQLARLLRSSGVWSYSTHFNETCLHPDTLISVPGDHRGGPPRVRIADLEGRSGVPVYAFDVAESRFRIATMKRCWKAKIAPEMVAITLDDGSVLRATPDHRVLNYDREWVLAGDLKPGDRLTALHHRYDVRIKDGDGRWAAESRLVAEWLEGRRLTANEHVDHMDPMRLDNRPEKLQVLTASDHARHTHAGKRLTEPINHCVVSVERIPGGPVYDMEVEGVHTFVAEGVVVHNCCTLAIEARASGCVPVCPPLAALAETARCEQGIFTPHVGDEGFADAFVDACVEATQRTDEERAAMADEALERHNVGVAAAAWERLLDA